MSTDDGLGASGTGRRKPPFPLCWLRRFTAGVLADVIGLWASLFVDMLEIVIIHRRVREERHVFLILRLRRPLDRSHPLHACTYSGRLSGVWHRKDVCLVLRRGE